MRESARESTDSPFHSPHSADSDKKSLPSPHVCWRLPGSLPAGFRAELKPVRFSMSAALSLSKEERDALLHKRRDLPPRGKPNIGKLARSSSSLACAGSSCCIGLPCGFCSSIAACGYAETSRLAGLTPLRSVQAVRFQRGHVVLLAFLPTVGRPSAVGFRWYSLHFHVWFSYKRLALHFYRAHAGHTQDEPQQPPLAALSATSPVI